MPDTPAFPPTPGFRQLTDLAPRRNPLSLRVDSRRWFLQTSLAGLSGLAATSGLRAADSASPVAPLGRRRLVR